MYAAPTDVATQLDQLAAAAAAMQLDPPRPASDAAGVFAALVREVDAGRVLVAMTEHGAKHRAAVDALALARDVLDDARHLWDDTAPAQLPAVSVAAARLRRAVAEACDDLRAFLDGPTSTIDPAQLRIVLDAAMAGAL